FATPRSSPFETSGSGESCPNASQVGVATLTAGGVTRHFGVFNLVPPFGAAAAIGIAPFGTHLTATVQLREGDSGLDWDLAEIPADLGLESLDLMIWGTPWEGDSLPAANPLHKSGHNPQRGNCLNEQTGGSWGECLVFDTAPAPPSFIKSMLTLPTTPCGAPLPYSADLRSWIGEEASAAAQTPALGTCNKALTVVKVQLMTAAAAARTGLAVNLDVNDGGGITN